MQRSVCLGKPRPSVCPVVLQGACDERLAYESDGLPFASASPVLTSLSRALIFSLPSDPSLLHHHLSFPSFIPGSFPLVL